MTMRTSKKAQKSTKMAQKSTFNRENSLESTLCFFKKHTPNRAISLPITIVYIYIYIYIPYIDI